MVSWVLDAADDRGRLLRAQSSLQVGETVEREHPYAMVVLGEQVSALCAVCLREADADICCDDCSRVYFCSEECRERLEQVHEVECEALEDMDVIASKSGVEGDLLRLLLRILAVRSLESPSERDCETFERTFTMNEKGEVVQYFRDLRTLVHSLDQLHPKWQDEVREGARRLISYLPADARLSEEEVLTIAAQVNENSYSIDAFDNKHLIAAVGMFPLTAMFNHSCTPNCTWSNGSDGVLEVRARRDIQAGEELTVNYIDIDMDRNERQWELERTKHFTCHCERCTTPLEESVDRYLQGLYCPFCPAEDDKMLLPTNDKQIRCTHCNKVNVGEWDVVQVARDVRKVLKDVKTQLHDKKYREVISTLASYRNGLEVQSMLLPFHPSHSIAMAIKRLLADAHMKLGDVELAYQLRKDLINGFNRVVPPNHMPLALAYVDCADAIQQLIDKPKVLRDSSLEEAELKEERQRYYNQAQDICIVCFSRQHPLCVRLRTLTRN